MRSVCDFRLFRGAFFLVVFFLFTLSLPAFAQTDTLSAAQTDTVPTKPKRVRDWKLSDYLQIHGFVEAQYDYTLQPENDGTMTKNSVMMLRRARFEFAGKFHPMLDFRLQADMAFTPRLLDAWLRVKFCKYAHLWIGQIKTDGQLPVALGPGIRGTIAVGGGVGGLQRYFRHPRIRQRVGNRCDAVGHAGGL